MQYLTKENIVITYLIIGILIVLITFTSKKNRDLFDAQLQITLKDYNTASRVIILFLGISSMVVLWLPDTIRIFYKWIIK